MPTPNNPSEIARETFRTLIARRITPTPDNYQRIYNEIAGVPDPAEPFPERMLRNLLICLPRTTPEQLRFVRELETAVQQQQWETFKNRLTEFMHQLASAQLIPWPELISELIRQWELRQSGITPAKKRESLESALRMGGHPEALYNRLNNIIRQWGQAQPAGTAVELVNAPHEDLPAREPDDVPFGSENSRNLFLYTLETAIAPLLEPHTSLSTEASQLAIELRKAHSSAAWKTLNEHLRKFAFHVALIAEDEAELRAGLMDLLRLMLDNVDELVTDDRWLRGQVTMIREIIDRPLSQRALEDAERRMKDVIFKQSQLKLRLNEAQEALKAMLVGFVDQLADFASATSDYHDKIERCAVKISQAENILDLQDVITEVMQETRSIQMNAQHSRDELRLAQQRVKESESRIHTLEQELEATSHLVRFDQLTGVLNRRGVEEMLTKELKRADRHGAPLCVALLDIDNFKKLNDTLGHDAGDAALIHLATVIRETLRPEDSVARFGGEEFILLLPDTNLEEAKHALVRLQRELTRRIFLYEHHKSLITFSAGVAQIQQGETQQSAIRRADGAMYQAKQSGKNQVCMA